MRRKSLKKDFSRVLVNIIVEADERLHEANL